MSKASGLFLVAGGLAVASLVTQLGDEPKLAAFAERTDIAKASAVEAPPVAAPAPAAMRSVTQAEPLILPPAPKPAVRPAPKPEAAAPPAAPAPVVVTLARRQSEPVSAVPSKVAAIPDRASLARELQRELRRVGCYDGEITGSWSPPTRKAMKAFTDRINASLPVDEPDYILLTLVQGYQDKACGSLCPAGQTLGAEARCVPNAILAQAGRRPQAPPQQATPPSAWAVTSTAVPPAQAMPGIEGRMALAGPQDGPVPVNAPLSPRREDTVGRADTQGRSPTVGVYERRPPQQRQARRRLDVGEMYRRLDSLR